MKGEVKCEITSNHLILYGIIGFIIYKGNTTVGTTNYDDKFETASR